MIEKLLLRVKAVQNNGLALKYASEELQNDSIIVMQAIYQNSYALKYASQYLKNDTNIAASRACKKLHIYFYILIHKLFL